MNKLLKILLFAVILSVSVVSVYSYDEESDSNVSTMLSASFMYYPTFKFGSAELDEHLTEPILKSNMAFSIQFGLKLWKDFKVVLNTAFGESNIEDNPIGFLSNLSAQFGFKRLLFSYKMQNISGSLVWRTDEKVFPEYTGPENRENFSINVTATTLQFDITTFIRFLDEQAIGGIYLGLLYFTYEGVAVKELAGYPNFYDGGYNLKGLGFSLGQDTMIGYSMYGYKPFVQHTFQNGLTIMPWLKYEVAWVFGIESSYSDDAKKRIKESPAIPDDVKTEGDSNMLWIIDGVLGVGFAKKFNFGELSFSLGYNFIFYQGSIGTLLHNEGIIVRASLKF